MERVGVGIQFNPHEISLKYINGFGDVARTLELFT
jgi:hypothetical protein